MGVNSSNSKENTYSKKYELEVFGRFIKKQMRGKVVNKNIDFDGIDSVIDNSLKDFTKQDYKNNKFEISNKVISDLENYAKQNNLEQEFSSILGEHQKDVLKTILSGKEIFSGKEQIVSLKDDTNDYVEKVLKNTFSNAYKFKMGLSRLKSFKIYKSIEIDRINEGDEVYYDGKFYKYSGYVDNRTKVIRLIRKSNSATIFIKNNDLENIKILDEEKQEILETLIKQIEENSEEYLDNADSFVEYMKQVLEKNGIEKTTEIEAIISIFKEVRDYNTLAHRVRGFHEDEASKEGLTEAINQNISELEFDIRFSKDGKAIIHHNASMGNSANRSEYIKDLEYSELRNIKLKNGGSITDLSDFFAMVKDSGNESTIINIDIKDFDKSGLDHILDLIKKYKFDHRVKIVSWSGQDLQYMYERRPDLHYSLSYHPITDGKLAKGLLNLQDKFQADNILAKLGTIVSKYRAGLVHSTGQEIIKKTRIENGKEYYGNSKLYKETGKGFHSMVAFNNDGVEGSDIFNRVLYKGSVNIMAFDEIIKKMPDFLKKVYYRKMKKLILELKELGIETNVFDIKDKKVLKKYFDNIGKGAGTVYSSNKETTIKIK